MLAIAAGGLDKTETAPRVLMVFMMSLVTLVAWSVAVRRRETDGQRQP